MKSSLPSEQRWVPVVSSTGLPLMPCRPVRARKPEDLQVISYSPWILIGNTDPLSVKLEHRQARRNRALLRSSLRGKNFLPAMNGGVPSSLYE